LLPLPSCLLRPLTELSAASGRDCSQKVFGPYLVPVGHGQASVSAPNGDVARSRSDADDPRKGDPSVGDSLLITNGRGT